MDIVTYAILNKKISETAPDLIANATDDWLEENVAQETGYVLDSSLSMSNAAAPADKVGELKTALTVLEPTATSADVGKALIAKTVADGKVTEYEFGEAGDGGASAIVNSVENVPIASFDDGTASAVKQIVVGIEPVQSGSGDPAPDNVRPITGWTGAKIQKTGKNLISSDKYVIGANAVRIGTSTNVADIVLKQGVYSLYVKYTTQVSVYIGHYDDAYSDYVRLGNTNTKILINITKPTDVIGLYVYSGSGVNPDSVESYLQVGNVTPEQIQSEVTTYSLTFPSAAGTVYGAKLINEGTKTWKLRVDHAEDDLGAFSWSVDERHPNKQFYSKRIGTKPHTDVICPIYKNLSSMSWGTNENYTIGLVGDDPYVLVVDNRYANTNEFKTAVTGIKLVYELANPVEYTITTADVIQLLAGYNNVWADTGDIKLLEYYADSKTYIDEENALVKALIAKELPSMVADTALTANDFRIVNNTLYRITTSVASGATLTPNTNCTATTITAVLKTLLS